MWFDRLDSRSWDRNLADLHPKLRFYHSATRKPAKEIQTLSYQICFVYIYPFNGYRELNSFEEPCFTLVATITSFARELNPTGVGEHIYCHPQTVSFYQKSSVWLDRLDSRSRDRNPVNSIYIYILILHELCIYIWECFCLIVNNLIKWQTLWQEVFYNLLHNTGVLSRNLPVWLDALTLIS